MGHERIRLGISACLLGERVRFDGGHKRDPDAARGRLLAHRAGRPELRPGFQAGDLTPKERLRLGVFGGTYMTDCHEEFPKSWFAGAQLCAERHDARLDCFGVNASQSLAVRRRSGWIHTQDPRGWFQWCCRYYMGQRSADDVRQIRRGRAIKRHVAAILKNCEPGDLECRRKQRQAVLHWVYDSQSL